ncbi:hypothetical protein K458DRAFT_360453 [Lentithecium fluviatile CBS 122367]|uniref:UBR-type domain-containing protein n=1 Tax=Lentithecium fluviatile CBS 122367 TaxID=1168545 RepID=A0A6G1JB29_9PLEO|nr:hypothetical protein K458DRAFT_360453 [Lentithecium fluviatile CBS 122367]
MADSQLSNGAQPQPKPKPKPRSTSISQASESSQTAADFIREQLTLEAEAREALPYQFDTCTRDLGPLKQKLYSCLDCNPPPANSSDPYVPAAVCYACSISCHCEHEMVELFNKRNFVCDCGTDRFPEKTPCNLRINKETGLKGGVTGEESAKGNHYNQNFRNKFCGCAQDYDATKEEGTMFQCLGLGTVADGGCGEDWWHPECLLGFSRKDFKVYVHEMKARKKGTKAAGITREISFTRTEEEANEHADSRRPSIVTAIAAGIANGIGVDGNDIAVDAAEEEEEEEEGDEEEEIYPPGFPAEEDFDNFLCYKCVEAHPWLKKYAGAPGFLPPRFFDAFANPPLALPPAEDTPPANGTPNGDHKKRKTSDDDDDSATSASAMAPPKRQKSVDPATALSAIPEDPFTITLPISPKKPSDDSKTCKLPSIPALSGPALTRPFSLFLKEGFYEHLCHCASCFSLLKPYPQLLGEEEVYEPPLSRASSLGSIGTGSILERGEAAFSNMNRVQALQGATLYAGLKDGLKEFLTPFAESGQAVGADDIKAFFAKLRGDEKGIQDAAGHAKQSADEEGDGSAGGDNRREQSGY